MAIKTRAELKSKFALGKRPKESDYSDLIDSFSHKTADAVVIPSSLSELADDTEHRLVTDTEKSTWNSKQDAGDYLTSNLLGANNGIAELDVNGKIPSTQLPSYVDDVVEYADTNSFPLEGTSGIIYLALDTELVYRWSGSTYVEISKSLALGTTETTAFRGDYGNTAYNHATQTAHAPSDAEKNVQADWNQTNDTQDDFIKNKPTIYDWAKAATKPSYTSSEIGSARYKFHEVDCSQYGLGIILQTADPAHPTGVYPTYADVANSNAIMTNSWIEVTSNESVAGSPRGWYYNESNFTPSGLTSPSNWIWIPYPGAGPLLTDPPYLVGDNDETHLFVTGGSYWGELGFNSFVQLNMTNNPIYKEGDTVSIYSDNDPFGISCNANSGTYKTQSQTGYLKGIGIGYAIYNQQVYTFTNVSSPGNTEWTLTLPDIFLGNGTQYDGWGNNVESNSQGRLQRFTLSEAQYRELDSQIGKVTTLTQQGIITINGVHSLNGINNSLMNQTIFLGNSFGSYIGGSYIQLENDFAVGSRVRFVDTDDSSQLILLPNGHSIAGATSAPDFNSYGIHYVGSQYYVNTERSLSAQGDTVELQYVGSNTWRVQFFDFASYVDGAIPLDKVDLSTFGNYIDGLSYFSGNAASFNLLGGDGSAKYINLDQLQNVNGTYDPTDSFLDVYTIKDAIDKVATRSKIITDYTSGGDSIANPYIAGTFGENRVICKLQDVGGYFWIKLPAALGIEDELKYQVDTSLTDSVYVFPETGWKKVVSANRTDSIAKFPGYVFDGTNSFTGSIPTVKTFDLIWNTETSIVYIWINDHYQDTSIPKNNFQDIMYLSLINVYNFNYVASHRWDNHNHIEYECYNNDGWTISGGDGNASALKQGGEGSGDGWGNLPIAEYSGNDPWIERYSLSKSEYLRIADVSSWYSWTYTPTPSNTTGKDGDFGLDSNGNVWKKVTGAWVDQNYNLSVTSYIIHHNVTFDELGLGNSALVGYSTPSSQAYSTDYIYDNTTLFGNVWKWNGSQYLDTGIPYSVWTKPVYTLIGSDSKHHIYNFPDINPITYPWLTYIPIQCSFGAQPYSKASINCPYGYIVINDGGFDDTFAVRNIPGGIQPIPLIKDSTALDYYHMQNGELSEFITDENGDWIPCGGTPLIVGLRTADDGWGNAAALNTTNGHYQRFTLSQEEYARRVQYDADVNGKLVVPSVLDLEVAKVRNIVLSTSAPSGMNDGDIWIQYVP